MIEDSEKPCITNINQFIKFETHLEHLFSKTLEFIYERGEKNIK